MTNPPIELGLSRNIGYQKWISLLGIRGLGLKKTPYVESNMKNNFKVKWFLDKAFKIEKCDVTNTLIAGWHLMGRQLRK